MSVTTAALVNGATLSSARTPAQHATSVARRPWHPGGIAGASAVRLVKTERGGGSGQWLATNYSVTGSPVVVGGTVYHTDWAGYLTAVALKAGGCVADSRPRGNPGKNAVVLHCPNHCPTAPSSSANLAYLSQFWVTPGRSRKPLCGFAAPRLEPVRLLKVIIAPRSQAASPAVRGWRERPGFSGRFTKDYVRISRGALAPIGSARGGRGEAQHPARCSAVR
jgi:hypothetical protein